jgi:hypothetical protein
MTANGICDAAISPVISKKLEKEEIAKAFYISECITLSQQLRRSNTA